MGFSPVAPRVAAVQDDFEQPSYAESRRRAMRNCLGEPLPDHPDDELQLAPFAFRQMVLALLHQASVAVCGADAKGIFLVRVSNQW